MNRIILAAQLLGALLLLAACSAIADPWGPQGDEAGTLKEVVSVAALKGKYENDTIDLDCTLVKLSPQGKSFRVQPAWDAAGAAMVDGALRGRRMIQMQIQSENQRFASKWAVISEITFPACDGSVREPAGITLKVDSDVVDYQEGGVTAFTRKVIGGTKSWNPANFRFEMAGRAVPGVRKIGSLTLKRGVVARAVKPSVQGGWGHDRIWGDPHLHVWMPSATAAKWELSELDASKNELRKARLVYLNSAGQPLGALQFRVKKLVKKVADGNLTRVELAVGEFGFTAR